ncbi:MAG TPA: ImmA/IrrE family metallo-endopeptidase [Candidatus Saccharimonadales bacterium]|nr:ImmA/IrrE family metallo-endopeptidase [Candidatus Saccharimonadales bacterium]
MAILSINDQRRIDSILEDIKIKTGFSYPENNLLDLAKLEDIKVYETDLSVLGPNISGVIEYDDDDKKINPKIFINKNISSNRKVFTLAHELAHHFLHKGRKLRIDTLDYSKNDQDTKEETEANYFAASLLVPANLLQKKINEGYSIEKLSEYFSVSVPVIKNRIKWLGMN